MEEIKKHEKLVEELKKEKDETIELYNRRILEATKKLAMLKDMEESKKYEAGKFDYHSVTIDSLETLSIIQLQYIIYDILGLNATYPLRYWNMSIFSRRSCRGDITWFDLNDSQYKRILCLYITEKIPFCKCCKKIKCDNSYKDETCDNSSKDETFISYL